MWLPLETKFQMFQLNDNLESKIGPVGLIYSPEGKIFAIDTVFQNRQKNLKLMKFGVNCKACSRVLGWKVTPVDNIQVLVSPIQRQYLKKQNNFKNPKFQSKFPKSWFQGTRSHLQVVTP